MKSNRDIRPGAMIRSAPLPHGGEESTPHPQNLHRRSRPGSGEDSGRGLIFRLHGRIRGPESNHDRLGAVGKVRMNRGAPWMKQRT